LLTAINATASIGCMLSFILYKIKKQTKDEFIDSLVIILLPLVILETIISIIAFLGRGV
jgi:hypothetical protein